MAEIIKRALFKSKQVNLLNINYVSLRFLKRKTSIPFDCIQKERRNQAQKSVLFAHRNSKENLLRFCGTYGSIGNAFFFRKADNGLSLNAHQQYALIEFSNISNVRRLLENTRHFPNSKRIPLDSRCLFLNLNPLRSKFRHNVPNCPKFEVNNLGTTDLSDLLLLSCSSVDHQMELVHKKQSLSELDIRLRFFIAAEVENLFRKLFPLSESHLFGSSVTGLGRYNGDVDITVDIEPHNSNGQTEFNVPYFLSKIRPEADRHFAQGVLESFGSIMKHFMPQMLNVKSILRARVPIVKFKHSSTEIDGDLCIGNREAIDMSRVLYNLLHHHESVLPLIFTIRQWAKCEEVTKSVPGPWLSNFMLTLLVIFYLQNHPQFLLPAIKNLEHTQNIDKSALKRMSKESLLLGFFKFYAEADLSKNGISVYDGLFIPKPEIKSEDQSEPATTEPLHLENPIERHLNAAKNVLEPDLLHFQKSCANAMDLLNNSPRPNPGNPWGLLSILSVNVAESDIESDENGPVATDEKISI